MQYSPSWKPQPGITVLSFGLELQGHNYTVQLSARDISPEQMLAIGNQLQFTTSK